jgi:hypothetical protein
MRAGENQLHGKQLHCLQYLFGRVPFIAPFIARVPFIARGRYSAATHLRASRRSRGSWTTANPRADRLSPRLAAGDVLAHSNTGGRDNDHAAARVDVWQMGQVVGGKLGDRARAGCLWPNEGDAAVITGGIHANVCESFIEGEQGP